MDVTHEIARTAQVLITLGGLFVVGLAADWLGRLTPFPRVTLLLVAGYSVGPSGLDWIPRSVIELFPILTAVALTMVGFLLGQRLTRSGLGRAGKDALVISCCVIVLTCAMVAIGLYILGAPLELALILGGIATATAPAAIVDVIHEIGAKGKFPDLLLNVVTIDDIWGLLLFSFLLAAAQSISGGFSVAALTGGLTEIGLALFIGIGLGLPLAFLTGRIRSGEPTQAEALGIVFLTAGLAVLLNVSYILSAIVLGATVAQLATHHSRPFHAIKGIEWPFLILFFILAGASLDFDTIENVGLIGGAYAVLRIGGRIAGASIGGRIVAAVPAIRHWLGLALLPQAGISIGLALHASHFMPEYSDSILTVVLGTTVLFELLGPPMTRAVLTKTPAGRL